MTGEFRVPKELLKKKTLSYSLTTELGTYLDSQLHTEFGNKEAAVTSLLSDQEKEGHLISKWWS